eukprot:CAMPEP_0201115728 /NCGR_PEP_ID=MMETSP0850-20130426/98_1 /ASSEMBLY_ACC=CAM_ASM_000622 /TAXON_ID=183588 /ORGANISM="Pseudo-nitzschia fraudulenta, Strain WWA7" /LENGTH=211 /DNA_ID=CAMNT_0047379493 /DNA_START=15 /DNA_END=651 /DNA_ORIENTATION=+
MVAQRRCQAGELRNPRLLNGTTEVNKTPVSHSQLINPPERDENSQPRATQTRRIATTTKPAASNTDEAIASKGDEAITTKDAGGHFYIFLLQRSKDDSGSGRLQRQQQHCRFNNNNNKQRQRIPKSRRLPIHDNFRNHVDHKNTMSITSTKLRSNKFPNTKLHGGMFTNAKKSQLVKITRIRTSTSTIRTSETSLDSSELAVRDTLFARVC